MVFSWNLTVLTKFLFVLKRDKKRGGRCPGDCFTSAAFGSVHVDHSGLSPGSPGLPVELHPQSIIGDVLRFPSFSVSLHHLSSPLPSGSLTSTQTPAEVCLHAVWSCLAEGLMSPWSVSSLILLNSPSDSCLPQQICSMSVFPPNCAQYATSGGTLGRLEHSSLLWWLDLKRRVWCWLFWFWGIGICSRSCKTIVGKLPLWLLEG